MQQAQKGRERRIVWSISTDMSQRRHRITKRIREA